MTETLPNHDSGFMDPAYLRAAEEVDGALGRIRTAVAGAPLRGRARLVVTADHGGRGTHGHAEETEPDDYRIPFIAPGRAPDPAATSRLSTVTTATRAPADRRTTGTSGPQRRPRRPGDPLLGLPPVPGGVFGVHDELDVR